MKRLYISLFISMIVFTVQAQTFSGKWYTWIKSNDISGLVKIPGIGNKTAARIILELKDKLKTEQTINQNEKITKVIDLEEKDTEAITALQVLGYTRKEISKVLEKIDTQNLTVEEIIKKALLTLGNQ